MKHEAQDHAPKIGQASAGSETERPISLIFDLIRRLAEQRGWMPIGWRVFAIGPWTVTVNGTPAQRDHIPPYHALIMHADIVAIIMVSPFGGSVGGWHGAEDAFIREIETALRSQAEVSAPN